jgi:hypothetical protein
LRLLPWSQLFKGGFNVRAEVAGNRHNEEGAVGENAGSELDGRNGEAAVAFARDGADLVVSVCWETVLVGL